MKNPKEHKFPYRWTLKDANFTKDKGTVFSCFACGGGSTMGYKLAGFDVLGCNEIDPKMMEVYRINHNPKYSYLEPIQEFKLREDLPEELYNLDILDGSPPCSSFSMAGNREKDWGKKKKFREGQSKQVLDTLFFDFIDLAKRLQPKVVIAENVKGILLGNAKEYLKGIRRAFDDAGYFMEYWLLDASKMGVPQRRERVFFIAMRKDIAGPFCGGLFGDILELDLEFREREIAYEEIMGHSLGLKLENKKALKAWEKCRPGKSLSTSDPKGHYFNWQKVSKKRSLPTIAAASSKNTVAGAPLLNPVFAYEISDESYVLGSSFPLDFNFDSNTVKYICGMSVPPVMTAQIASRIWEQWLSKIN